MPTPKKINPQKAGRKSAWEIKIQPRLEVIAGWCRAGYTDKEICKALTISQETFCKYKKLKPELLISLKNNKAIADMTVENSLYLRATGYTYEEKTQEAHADDEGNIISKKIKTVKKTVLPDTTAQIFWLKNRRKEWTDRKQLEHSGPNGGPVEIKKEYSKEELEAEMKRRGIPIPKIEIENIK